MNEIIQSTLPAILSAVAAGAGAYGAVRAELRALHERVAHAAEDVRHAHRRIDELLQLTRNRR